MRKIKRYLKKFAKKENFIIQSFEKKRSYVFILLTLKETINVRLLLSRCSAKPCKFSAVIDHPYQISADILAEVNEFSLFNKAETSLNGKQLILTYYFFLPHREANVLVLIDHFLDVCESSYDLLTGHNSEHNNEICVEEIPF